MGQVEMRGKAAKRKRIPLWRAILENIFPPATIVFYLVAGFIMFCIAAAKSPTGEVGPLPPYDPDDD